MRESSELNDNQNIDSLLGEHEESLDDGFSLHPSNSFSFDGYGLVLLATLANPRRRPASSSAAPRRASLP